MNRKQQRWWCILQFYARTLLSSAFPRWVSVFKGPMNTNSFPNTFQPLDAFKIVLSHHSFSSHSLSLSHSSPRPSVPSPYYSQWSVYSHAFRSKRCSKVKFNFKIEKQALCFQFYRNEKLIFSFPENKLNFYSKNSIIYRQGENNICLRTVPESQFRRLLHRRSKGGFFFSRTQSTTIRVGVEFIMMGRREISKNFK